MSTYQIYPVNIIGPAPMQYCVFDLETNTGTCLGRFDTKADAQEFIDGLTSPAITRQTAVTILTMLDFPIDFSELSGIVNVLDALTDTLQTNDLETLARHFAVVTGTYSNPEDVALFPCPTF